MFIKELVVACDVCQRNKYATPSPAGLLQPLQVPTSIWISMDFVRGFTNVKGEGHHH